MFRILTVLIIGNVSVFGAKPGGRRLGKILSPDSQKAISRSEALTEAHKNTFADSLRGINPEYKKRMLAGLETLVWLTEDDFVNKPLARLG